MELKDEVKVLFVTIQNEPLSTTAESTRATEDPLDSVRVHKFIVKELKLEKAIAVLRNANGPVVEMNIHDVNPIELYPEKLADDIKKAAPLVPDV